MLISILARLVAGLFRPGITPVKTGPTAPSGIEQDGALIPNGALVGALTALSFNASPAYGNWSQSLIPASLAAATYNAQQLVGGIIRRFSTGSNTSDSTDTATNIVNAIPGAVPLQTFPLIIANLGSGSLTLAGGTGVTIAGTAVIASNGFRLFLGQITSSTAVTITNCFQWGGGSGYTAATGL